MSRKDCGKSGLTFDRPSLTKKQFADECDLGKVVKRFLKTGQLPANTGRRPIAGVDVSNMPDNLQDALEPSIAARQAFEQLPIEERNKFNNNPEAWAIAMEQAKAKPVDTASVDKPVDKPVDTASVDKPVDKPVDTTVDKPQS